MVCIDETEGIGLSDVGMVAAPLVGIERVDYLGPNRIEVYVLEKCQKVIITVTEYRFVSPLEEVPDGLLFPIEIY